MLEFIVLGQIPGTTIQINYSGLIAGVSLVLALVLAYVELSRIRAHFRQKSTAQKLDLTSS